MCAHTMNILSYSLIIQSLNPHNAHSETPLCKILCLFLWFLSGYCPPVSSTTGGINTSKCLQQHKETVAVSASLAKETLQERQMAAHGITINRLRLEKEIIKEAKSPELQELGVVYCFKGFQFMQDYICFSTENIVGLFHCQVSMKLLPTQIVHRAYMPRSELEPRS